MRLLINNLQKRAPLRSEKGVAILTVMMLLFLVSGVSLFVFQNAATERQIATASIREYAALSLAESGIEQALSWFADPTTINLPSQSKKRSFFEGRSCKKTKEDKKPDFSDTVSLLDNRIELRFYKSRHKKGVCVVEARAKGRLGVSIDLAKNPMVPITAGVQGAVPVSGKSKSDMVVHWGKIRNRGEADLDAVNLNELIPFIKRFGRYFVISPHGSLEENGIDLGLFDQVFLQSDRYNSEGAAPLAGSHASQGTLPLVFIDTQDGYSATAPLRIAAAAYRGYFYFSGDIHIVGKGSGRSILATPPPPPNAPRPEMLNDIHLEGFFYTLGKMILDHPLFVYGAMYAGSGFEGEGSNHTVVWYNDRFRSGSYPNVIPLIRIPGTWQTM